MRKLRSFLLTTSFLTVSAAIALGLSGPARAATTDPSSLLSADQVTYDETGGIVKASGNVEIVQGDRILKADNVIYDVNADTVQARGNIVLLEPSGDVLFAEDIRLENQLKTGLIRDIRILFTDSSRLAANSAEKIDENRTVMSKAVYSTCAVCEKDPSRPPVWQVKSAQVIHNKDEKTIEYKNAFLEFLGVPVLYTPYFTHPDPSVKRGSGFLAPTVSSSSELGYGLKTPYYYVISGDKDLTVTPYLLSKEGLQLAAEYRQAVASGKFEFDVSGTYVDKRDTNNVKTGGQEFRGHISGDGKFTIDPVWNWGFDIARASDDTYLDRYDISGADSLTSNVYLQGRRGRNYASLSAYSFQGLNAEDDSGETPIIPAWWEYSYIGKPGSHGQRFGLDMDALILERTSGQDTRRLSLSGSWMHPYTAPSGEIYTLNAALRGDGYWTSDQLDDPNDPTSPTSSNLSGRFVPSISLEWKYPWVRQTGTVRQTIEPIVQASWSDSFGKSEHIPNEDSLSFEFDDTNLFGPGRYAGLDEVEEGARLNYGMNFGFYGQSGGYTNLLIGQSFHTEDDTGFAEGSGLEDQLSDYVARLDIRPNEYLDFTTRLRIDRDQLKLQRNEINMRAGSEKNWLNFGYVFLGKEQSSLGLVERQEVYIEGKLQMSDFWSVYSGYRRDLENKNSIDGFMGVEYLDECFSFNFGIDRSFTRDRDVEPETKFRVQLKLLPFN